MKVELTLAELKLVIRALPYVGDREIEEEVDHASRVGDQCDALCDRLSKILVEHS